MTKTDISQVPLAQVMKRLNHFMDNDKDAKRSPEDDAILFYLLNHAFSVIKLKHGAEEDLGALNEVVERYFHESGEIVARAFYYMLLICTRESRHLKSGESFRQKIQAKYGSVINQFNQTILQKGSTGTAAWLRSNPPDCKLGMFTDSLVFMFNEGHWNGGYGGKKWGQVAHCMNEFVWGRYSAETMVDTVWTLCHNNGPIFNKGMLYGPYTHELTTILDVQRSGQIPNLLYDHVNGNKYVSVVTARHISTYEALVNLMPDLGHYLDWFKVEKLGAVETYEDFKEKQVKKYGQPGDVSKIATESDKVQVEKETDSVSAGEGEPVMADGSSMFQITPTQAVKKLSRAEVKLALANTVTVD